MKLASIAVQQVRPMTERRALPAYALVALGLLLTAIAVPLAGFTVAPSVWTGFFLMPFIAVAGMLARRIGLSRLATALESGALLYGQGLSLLLLLFPLAAFSAPYADAALAKADSALGFDWVAYARLIEPAIDPLVLAYKSFHWQPALLIAALIATAQTDRLWRLVTAASVAGLATAALFPLFPARGAFVHYQLTGYALKGDGPLAFSPILDLLKSGHRVISPDLFTGLVSMPSYHAASAAMFVWAGWRVRLLRWPLLALNLALCAAAIVVGGHYLVDILVGLAIGAASVGLTRPSPARRTATSPDLR